MVKKFLKALVSFVFLVIVIGSFCMAMSLLGVLIFVEFMQEGRCNDIDFLELANAKFTAQRSYINDSSTANYTCINYSKDFQNTMTEFGYDIEIVGGYPNKTNTSGHMWNKVCFDYEPQGTGFTDFAEQYPRPLGDYWEDRAKGWEK